LCNRSLTILACNRSFATDRCNRSLPIVRCNRSFTTLWREVLLRTSNPSSSRERTPTPGWPHQGAPRTNGRPPTDLGGPLIASEQGRSNATSLGANPRTAGGSAGGRLGGVSARVMLGVIHRGQSHSQRSVREHSRALAQRSALASARMRP
jgi:hypothetical protein